MPHGFNYTHFKDFTLLLFFGPWLLIYHNAGILHSPHSEELDQLCRHPSDPTEPQGGGHNNEGPALPLMRMVRNGRWLRLGGRQPNIEVY